MLDRMIANEMEHTLENFRRTFDRFFEGNYPTTRHLGTNGNGTDTFFTPAVETVWTKDNLNLRFIVPGVSRDELDVTIQGNQLLIRGERKAPEYTAKESTFYSGLAYGRFERVVDLPNGLELSKMDVHLHDGILDIWIPKTAEMKPKKIQIGTGDSRRALVA
jgi:HSP20 family protein